MRSWLHAFIGWIFASRDKTYAEFGPFAAVLKSPGEPAPLVLLSMRGAEVGAVIRRIEQALAADDAVEGVDALFGSPDWRPHLVGAAALILDAGRRLDPSSIWKAIDAGSWVTPQLVTTAYLIDPSFARSGAGKNRCEMRRRRPRQPVSRGASPRDRSGDSRATFREAPGLAGAHRIAGTGADRLAENGGEQTGARGPASRRSGQVRQYRGELAQERRQPIPIPRAARSRRRAALEAARSVRKFLTGRGTLPMSAPAALFGLPTIRRAGYHARGQEGARRACARARIARCRDSLRSQLRVSAAGAPRHPWPARLAEARTLRARHSPRGPHPELPGPASVDQPRGECRAACAGRGAGHLLFRQGPLGNRAIPASRGGAGVAERSGGDGRPQRRCRAVERVLRADSRAAGRGFAQSLVQLEHGAHQYHHGPGIRQRLRTRDRSRELRRCPHPLSARGLRTKQSRRSRSESSSTCASGSREDAQVAEFYAGVGAIGLSVLPRVREIRFNEVSPQSLQGLAFGIEALEAAERRQGVGVPGPSRRGARGRERIAGRHRRPAAQGTRRRAQGISARSSARHGSSTSAAVLRRCLRMSRSSPRRGRCGSPSSRRSI